MPGAIPNEMPKLLIVATPVFVELQVALCEMSWVVESLNVAVAVKRWPTPAGIVGAIGVTVIVWGIAFVTLRVMVWVTLL